MARFTDNNGREWVISVDIATLRRVKNKLDFDLLGGEGKAVGSMQRLGEDPYLLADTLYVLCEDEANKRGISDEDFGRSLTGDAIGNAADALMEAIADFFPQAKRERLRKVLVKAKEVEQAGLAMTDQKLAELDVQKVLQAAMKRGKPSTN